MKVHGHQLTKFNAGRIAAELKKSQHQLPLLPNPPQPRSQAQLEIEGEVEENLMQIDDEAAGTQVASTEKEMVLRLIECNQPVFVINVKGVDNELFV